MPDPEPKLPFVESERRMQESAAFDLPTLPLAERASDLLARTLTLIDVKNRTDASPPREIQERAAVYLGIIGARSLRAAMTLVKSGYDMDAFVFMRRIEETHARLIRYLTWEDGAERAAKWLDDSDGKARVGITKAYYYYYGMSGPAHAYARAVDQHLVTPGKAGRSAFNVLPLRKPETANALIITVSMKAFYIAQDVSKFMGQSDFHGSDLHRDLLQAHIDRIHVPYDEAQARKEAEALDPDDV